MASASCGTQPATNSEVIENTCAAVEAIKKPDSFYLAACRDIPALSSDSLGDISDAVRQLMIDYADCAKRHKLLAEQVSQE